MKIKNIKERVNDLFQDNIKDYSSFYLVEVYRNDNHEIEINEILPLERDTQEIELTNNHLIVDRDGNILLNNLLNDERIVIRATIFDGNNIIARAEKKYKNDGKSNRYTYNIKHYKYCDDKLSLVRTLFDSSNGEKLRSSYRPLIESDVLYVSKVKTSLESTSSSYLYSVSNAKRITPKFKELDPIEGTSKKIYKFQDVIESTEKANGKPISTTLIGYINLEGIFSKEIFDERENKVRIVDLNSHPETVQYDSLRNALIWNLNNQVEEINEKEKSKNEALKVLELTAKITLNK